MSNRVKELEATIINAAKEYYTTGKSPLTDDQFDTLVEELRLFRPTHPILTTPGWSYKSENNKHLHIGKNLVGSLDKIKYPEKSKSEKVLVMPKLDGLSVVIYAGNNTFMAITRGNGQFGEDCTDKIKSILTKKNPLALKNLVMRNSLVAIRGEVMTDAASQKFFKDQGILSPRNWAAGVLNRKELTDDLQHLIFIPYFIRLDEEKVYRNLNSMLEELSTIGFDECPSTELENNPEELKKLHDEWKAQCLIDGLVLLDANHRFDGPDQRDGDYTRYESLSIAYKFQGETANVRVEKLLWNTGSTGRITPVAQFSPVFLSGAEIRNVSLHHASYAVEQGIGPGAEMTIVRSGEVIPYVLDVPSKSPVELPKACPACDGEVALEGFYLVCQNDFCSNKSYTTLFKFFESVVGMPEGLSHSTIKKWLEEFPVNTTHSKVDNIFDFLIHFGTEHHNTAMRTNILQERFGEHYGMLLWRLEVSIEKKLKEGISYQDFWYITNLPGLGVSNAQKLGQINPLTLSDTPVGLPTSSNVLLQIQENLDYIRRLANKFNLIKTVEEKKKDIGLLVAVTGSVCTTRSKWTKKLEEFGIKVGSVNSKTRFLVNNEDKGSSKSKAAEAIGVKVVNESEFYNILEEQYGIKISF